MELLLVAKWLGQRGRGRLILDRDSFVIRYFLCGSRVSLFLGDIVSSGPETRDGPD